MSPIISVDGMTPAVLEATRVGIVAPVFWDHVDRIQAAAAAVGRPLSFSMCVMSTNWREVPLVLAEADRRGAYVSLALVNQPFRFDLFRLPTAELEHVRRTWADTPLALTSGHLVDEWERLQGLVSRQVEQPVELQISIPHRMEAPVDERVQAELAGKMAAAAGEEPLSFEVDDGRVRLRNRPEWAQWLVAGGFDGSAFADLEDLIAANTGGRVAVGRLAREHKGVSRWMLAVQLPESSRRLEINFFADEATGQARALVVPDTTGGPPG
jgi:hypothetical protein